MVRKKISISNFLQNDDPSQAIVPTLKQMYKIQTMQPLSMSSSTKHINEEKRKQILFATK